MNIYGTRIVMALLALLLGQQMLFAGKQTTKEMEPSAYERVMSSKTLRCGYFEEAPFTVKDPNTGDMRGISVDLAKTIASELGLKVEWGVTTFSTLTEDLRLNKFDAICASVFVLPRAGRVDYTLPYAYVPVKAYVNPDFIATASSLEQVNWNKTTIAGLDGEGATTAARKRLPQANYVVLPAMSSVSEMLTTVATDKADLAFVIPTVFADYERANPGKLVPLASALPLHVFPISFAVKVDEPALKNMLDMMIYGLQASGALASLVNQYDPNALLYQVRPPYEMPAS